MIKSATATSLFVLLLAMAPTATQAEDIKDLVSDAQLADFCGAAGVGTETTATLELADGTTATGSIECEAEDLIVGDAADDELDDVDEEEDEDEDDSDEEDEDDSEGDDSEDDDTDDSESSDDDSGSDDGDDSAD